MLTLNGRLSITRTRWHGDVVGSCTVIDGYLDRADRTISVGLYNKTNNNLTNLSLMAQTIGSIPGWPHRSARAALASIDLA